MCAMTESSDTSPRQAIVLNRDLLFGSRIRNALATMGIAPRFTRDTPQFVAALGRAGPTTVIAIVDMNGAVDWSALGAALAQPGFTTPVLAFGPHTDVENRRAAKAAGVNRIVSNGQFHESMAELIDRYRSR